LLLWKQYNVISGQIEEGFFFRENKKRARPILLAGAFPCDNPITFFNLLFSSDYHHTSVVVGTPYNFGINLYYPGKYLRMKKRENFDRPILPRASVVSGCHAS